jgi:hypothetical protein
MRRSVSHPTATNSARTGQIAVREIDDGVQQEIGGGEQREPSEVHRRAPGDEPPQRYREAGHHKRQQRVQQKHARIQDVIAAKQRSGGPVWRQNPDVRAERLPYQTDNPTTAAGSRFVGSILAGLYLERVELRGPERLRPVDVTRSR